MTMNDNIVQMEWLGINGFRFQHQDETILLDPYVTRNRSALCDPELVQRLIPNANHIVITHSHWDHLADAHIIAKTTGAKVIGSATTRNICSSHGVRYDQLIEAKPFFPIDRGNFTVTYFPSMHILQNGEVPYAGTYDLPPKPPPTTAPDYLEGGTFAALFDFGGGTSVLNIGSANVIEEHLRGLRPTVLIVSAAGWKSTPEFVERVLEAVHPAMIIPAHYDALEGPLDDGIQIRDPAGLEEFEQELAYYAQNVPIKRLDYFETLKVQA